MVTLDLDELQTFVAVAQLGGFGRAALALHRSQPAISRRIELLEGELKTALFDRVPSGVVLTDAGRALLPYAESALAALKDGAEAVHALNGRGHGSVSLAVVGTLANAKLMQRLTDLRKRDPGVRVEIRTANSREVSELVRRGEATFGLRYVEDRAADLVSCIVEHEALLVVCAADHPLADGRAHVPSELSGQRWVAFPTRASQEGFAQFLERTLIAAGLEAPEIIAIDSLTAQKRLVEAGLGIAMLAASGVEEELARGSLKVVDIPQLRLRIPVTVVYRPKGYRSPAALELLSALGVTLDEVSTPKH
jgi:DNA-binding transcriptional LysR family regulator